MEPQDIVVRSYYVMPRAFDPSVSAPGGVQLGSFSILGKNIYFGAGTKIGGNVEIGDNVTIGAGAVIGNEVEIRNGATICPGAQLANKAVVDVNAMVQTGEAVPKKRSLWRSRDVMQVCSSGQPVQSSVSGPKFTPRLLPQLAGQIG
jgi:NDP-sugar pyrophosphorylase family protein